MIFIVQEWYLCGGLYGVKDTVKWVGPTILYT
jgi:hypothetical protein